MWAAVRCDWGLAVSSAAVLLTGVGKRYDIVSCFAALTKTVAADPNSLAPAQYAAPRAAVAPGAPPAGDDLLVNVEREHIQRALLRANGNKKAAARMLGVSRRALYRRLERLGLDSTISRRSHADGAAVPAAAEEGPLEDSMPGALD